MAVDQLRQVTTCRAPSKRQELVRLLEEEGHLGRLRAHRKDRVNGEL